MYRWINFCKLTPLDLSPEHEEPGEDQQEEGGQAGEAGAAARGVRDGRGLWCCHGGRVGAGCRGPSAGGEVGACCGVGSAGAGACCGAVDLLKVLQKVQGEDGVEDVIINDDIFSNSDSRRLLNLWDKDGDDGGGDEVGDVDASHRVEGYFQVVSVQVSRKLENCHVPVALIAYSHVIRKVPSGLEVRSL